MHNQVIRRDIQLVLIASDDQAALSEQTQACEAAGLQVVSAEVGASAFGIAIAGAPSVMIVSLATDAGLLLLQQFAHDPRTAHIPVIVSAWHSEQVRVRAEQVGSVALFLDQHSPRTLLSAAHAVMGLRDDESPAESPEEFPAQCPKCNTRAGMPRSVSTASLAGTYVGLQCTECGQGWRVLRPGAAPPRTPS